MRTKRFMCLLLVFTFVASFTLNSFAHDFSVQPNQGMPLGTRTIVKEETVTGSELADIIEEEQLGDYLGTVAVAGFFAAVGQNLWTKILAFMGGTIVGVDTDIDTDILDAYDDGTLEDIDSIDIKVTYVETYNQRNPSEVVQSEITKIRMLEN